MPKSQGFKLGAAQVVSFSRLEDFVSACLPLSSTDRQKMDLISRLAGIRKLLSRGYDVNTPRLFSVAYCGINFVAPTIGLTSRAENDNERSIHNMFYYEREKFLEIMAGPFYDMFEEELVGQKKVKRGFALDIFRTAPGELRTNYTKEIAGEDLTRVISKVRDMDARRIVERANLALADVNLMDFSLESQLRLLAAGIVTPKMFGVRLSNYEAIKGAYADCVRVNGDFEMPMPKNAKNL